VNAIKILECGIGGIGRRTEVGRGKKLGESELEVQSLVICTLRC